MRWPQVHIVYRLASPGSRSNICDSSFATGMVIIIITQRLAWKSCRHLGSSEEFFFAYLCISCYCGKFIHANNDWIQMFTRMMKNTARGKNHTTGDPSRDFHSSVRPIPFHSLWCCHFSYNSFHQEGSPPAYILKARIAGFKIPQKNLNFPQICPKMLQNGPKMAKYGPKWPKKAQNYPKMTQNDPK